MSRRADAVQGSAGQALHDLEHGSGVGPASSQGAALAPARWPLRSYLELGALPTAVPCARLHARLVVGEWGLEALAGAIELVVSELVTNAVQASERAMAGREGSHRAAGLLSVRLWLRSEQQQVLIQVWDADHRMPEQQNPGPQAGSGRGLLLVEAMSTQWGSYLSDGGLDGKVVWALVDTP